MERLISGAAIGGLDSTGPADRGIIGAVERARICWDNDGVEEVVLS